MSDVFISYVEEDADVVEPLADGLTEAGYSCWCYQHSSLPGPSYLLQVSQAIAACQVVLLVLSPHTLGSHQVDKEVNYAHEFAKPFLPITRNLAWGDFQQRRPTWRMAVGTAAAIPLPDRNVTDIVPRLIQGLRLLRVVPADAALSAPAATATGAAATTYQSSVPSRSLADSLTLPGNLPARTPFVGRPTELAYLKAQYDAVAQGKGGRLIFISGEPGVGKTRLAQEVGLYAWGKGGLFLEGTYVRDVTAPYGAWIDALRIGLRAMPADVLGPVVGSYGAELAQLFPELVSQFGPFQSPSLPSQEQRRRLFDGLVELVGGLSRRTPLMLLLNDLQWAPGLPALIHVARRLSETQTLVVATYREQEFKDQLALMQDWAELNRGRLASQLNLHPLTNDESTRLTAQYFGETPAQQLGELLYRRTRGNPFFLEEVFRSLTETGAVQAGTSGWEVADLSRIAVPESIKLVVEERVSRLGDSGRELLTQAAVLGREFSLPALLALTSQPEEQVLDILDRGIAARLLIDCSVAAEERFAFADDQVQEVLYGSLTALRRRRAHLRAGQVIEALYAGQLDGHLEELAHHFLAGSDLPKALDYALRAGERAYALSSWERAVHHFETALELFGELPEDLAQQAHALERLAVLNWVLVRPGIHHIQRALELYTRLGNNKKAARMHRLLGTSWMTGLAGGVDLEKAIELTRCAVELLADEPDSAEHVYSYSWLSGCLIWGWIDLEPALDNARRALAVAERLNKPDYLALARSLISQALAYRGELTLADAEAERSWEAAARGRDAWSKTTTALWPVITLWRNDREWTGRWLDRYHEQRQRLLIALLDPPGYGMSALFAALMARPDEAKHALERVGEANTRTPLNHPFYLGVLAGAAHGIIGDRNLARRLFVQGLDASDHGHLNAFFIEGIFHYARFLLTTGDLVTAEAVLRRGYGLAREKASVVQELNLLSLLCELHVRTGRLDDANRNLVRAGEIMARPQPWRGLAAAVHRSAGLLGTSKAAWLDAEHAFARALDVEHQYGFPYNEAQILLPWAELYFQRDEPGDRERGLEKLGQALAIFEQCAAKKDVERVLARRAELMS
ncbi:MAG: AAA family ATPase [Chloroflexi bacterium]|nr:AAA family ATPase [Chloroflexota bacterium]